MKKLVVSIYLVLITSSFCAQSNKKFSDVADLQFVTGLNRGPGFGGNLFFHDISVDFPFDFRFGIGYTWLNPGNSSDARRIFINDATNGTPEKKGRNWDLRMDLMKKTKLMGHSPSYWYFGPRYSSFKGNFKYVGGNEDFDVTSKQFGIGGGIESHFEMSNQLSLILSAGLDYFLPSKLQGHDTAYSPDNDNVNPRTNKDTGEKYSFKDANKAISQPQFMPRIQIGIQWDF